jgi:hypothetical protein
VLCRSEPRLKVAATTEEAASWLAPKTGRSERELRAFARWAFQKKLRSAPQS